MFGVLWKGREKGWGCNLCRLHQPENYPKIPYPEDLKEYPDYPSQSIGSFPPVIPSPFFGDSSPDL